jgi:site-specific recombinase XerD
LDQHKCVEDITERDIQQYILYLKKKRGLSAGTINNYISAVKLLYTFVLNKDWNSRKIPRMKRLRTFPVIHPKEDVLTI